MPRRAAAALAAALLLAGCGGGRPANRILVATEAHYPPFEIVDASGEIVGFDVDLVRAAAREGGLEAEFVDQPFEGILPGLKQGKYDAAVSALTITEERAREVDFTDPYYEAGQVVAVREGEAGIRGREDLRGRTVAVQLATTGNTEADRIGGATVKTFKSAELAFLELLAGRADAVVNDEPTTLLFMKEHPGLKTVGPVFTAERYGIAVRKERPDVRRALNDGLAKVRASGEYDRLKAKWIGGK